MGVGVGEGRGRVHKMTVRGRFRRTTGVKISVACYRLGQTASSPSFARNSVRAVL